VQIWQQLGSSCYLSEDGPYDGMVSASMHCFKKIIEFCCWWFWDSQISNLCQYFPVDVFIGWVTFWCAWFGVGYISVFVPAIQHSWLIMNTPLLGQWRPMWFTVDIICCIRNLLVEIVCN